MIQKSEEGAIGKSEANYKEKQERAEPGEPCHVRLARQFADLFGCDRSLIQSERPRGQPIFEDNFNRILKEDYQSIIYNEKNKDKFKPMPKHNWYSLAGVKQMLLCLSPEIPPDDQTKTTISEKANMIEYTQQDLLLNEYFEGHQYNEKELIFNNSPTLKLKTSKDAPKAQHLALQKIKQVQESHRKSSKELMTKKQLDSKQVEVKNRAARKLLQQRKAAKFFTEQDGASSSNVSTSNILVNDSGNTSQTKVQQPMIYFEDVDEDMSEYTYQDSPDRRKTKADIIKEIPPMSQVLYEKEVNQKAFEINPEPELVAIDPPIVPQTVQESQPKQLKFAQVQQPNRQSPDPLKIDECQLVPQFESPELKPVQPKEQTFVYEEPIAEPVQPVVVYKFADIKPKEKAKGKGKKKKTKSIEGDFNQEQDFKDNPIQIIKYNQPEPEEKSEVEIINLNETSNFKGDDSTIQLSVTEFPTKKRKSRMGKLTFYSEETQFDQYS